MEMLVKSFVPPEARAKEPDVAARASEVRRASTQTFCRQVYRGGSLANLVVQSVEYGDCGQGNLHPQHI